MSEQQVKETLEKQLALLSERSRDAENTILVPMSNAMVYIAEALNRLFPRC